jgi:hypothetical protein
MKTVIEMAREATLLDSRDDWSSVPDEYREAINAFAELVRADEREACAKVCEMHAPTTTPTYVSYAAAIRARSNT